MSEEEKKAIEYWKRDISLYHYNTQLCSEHYAQIILNLIENQQKEIEELKEEYNTKLLSNAGIYQLGFNDGIKTVEGKIKAKILECRKILYSFEKELELKANKESMNCLLGQISILQSLLEEE